ncbi:UNKNOWN [Stylonychia lemnae]|uniref:Uncharacterized protein n=1 Tax=Stylonychia lemnae TaxID=5949 RepID=A0A077ZS86_STYLE|nr:UNKNOWN [Stylonychia lemnae]|eukprot:CDW72742.1 UNKNOWN [Stylonychia lemnae]
MMICLENTSNNSTCIKSVGTSLNLSSSRGRLQLSLFLAFTLMFTLLQSPVKGQVIINEGNFRLGQLKSELESILAANFREQTKIQEEHERLGLPKPNVEITQQEFLNYAFQLSRGLGIINYYTQTYDCIVNASTLFIRYQNLFESFSGYNSWLEFSLAIGNTSTWYKGCYLNSEGSVLSLYYYVMEYRSLQNYLTYFLPNMLSYAFVVNTWIDKMNALSQQQNTTGLMYYYGMIVRNIFFFPMPEAESFYSGNEYAQFDQNSNLVDDTLTVREMKLEDRFTREFKLKLEKIMKDINNEDWEENPQGDNEQHEDCEETVVGGRDSMIHRKDVIKIKSQNIQVQQQMKLFSLLDYVKFSYQFVYYFVQSMWSYNQNSFFTSCNKNLQGMTNQTILFSNYAALVGSNRSDFKELSFSFVTIFEYIYPISSFCVSASNEVADDTVDRFNILFREPQKIFENSLRRLGSILMNAITVPDCFFNQTLDGICAGTKTGNAVNYILFIS